MTTPGPPAAPSRGVTVVLGLRLVSEFALVAGAAWAASTRPRGVLLAVAAGILAALAVAAVWAVLVAPGSGRRLADPYRLGLEIALFVAVGLGLAAAGHVPAALVVGVAGSATAVGVRLVDRAEPVVDVRTAEGEPQLRRPRGADRARRRR